MEYIETKLGITTESKSSQPRGLFLKAFARDLNMGRDALYVRAPSQRQLKRIQRALERKSK